MSGELIAEKIKPDNELVVEGNLRVTGKVIIENPEVLESNDNSVATKSQMRAYVQEISYEIMPIGTIVPFSGNKDQVPDSWLPCDGSEKLIDENNKYYSLYQIIGKQWGGTDTTFRLPNLEGRFLRGADNGSGTDSDAATRIALYSEGNSGDAVGSYQDDAFQGHKHETSSGSGHSDAADFNPRFGGTVGDAIDKFSGLGGFYGIGTYFSIYTGDVVSDGVNVPLKTSSETRPKNAAVNFIIKY